MAESSKKFLDPKARETMRHLGLEDYRQEVVVPAREMKPWFGGLPGAILLGITYILMVDRLKPVVGNAFGTVFAVIITFLILQIKDFRKTTSGKVVANSEGIRLEGRKGWSLSWSQIGGIRVQSKPDSTVIYTIDGNEKRLPFALAGPTQFDHNISNLKEMFESRGIHAAYSVVETVPMPKAKLSLYQADLLRYLSVACLIVGMVVVALYSQAHSHSPFTWIDAIPAGIGISIGVGMFVASQVMRNRIRAALSAVGEIQMGRTKSLYRQLTGRESPVYGRYKYPDPISDRDSFNLGCRDPKSVLAAPQKDLYWTKEGLRLTPDGPICRHSILYYPNSDGKSTMTLRVIPPDWNPMEVTPNTSQRLSIWFLSRLVKLPSEPGLTPDNAAKLMAANKALPQFDPRFLELVEE